MGQMILTEGILGFWYLLDEVLCKIKFSDKNSAVRINRILNAEKGCMF